VTRVGAIRLRLAALVAIAAVTGCALSAPPFPTIVPWNVDGPPLPSVEPDERKLWEEATEDVGELRESKTHFEDAALSGYLEGLVARLAPPLAEGGPSFRIELDTSVEDNAMALPDGTIVIALPLLASFDSEAQVASILAHEIVHVTRRHSLLSSRYDALTSSHVERMRFSRRLEAEADRIGIALVSAAGYDPHEAERALAHVVGRSPDAPHTVRAWNSHDYLPDRLDVIGGAIAALDAPGRAKGVEAFERAIGPFRLKAAELELEADRFDSALEIVARQIERHPDGGPAYALRARIQSAKDPASRRSKPVGDDFERAVELGPKDPESLRALGLFLRDTGESARSNAMLRRYLAARPDAFDRKLIERYLAASPE